MHPDTSDLPRAPCASHNLKGKAGEKPDLPPYVTQHASLETGGNDFFVKEYFSLFLHLPPMVTRSQAKNTRFDPMKGGRS